MKKRSLEVLNPLDGLEFKSRHDKARVVRELGIQDSKARDFAAHEIAVSIGWYIHACTGDLAHKSDAHERDQAKRAADALKTAIAAIEELGRDATTDVLVEVQELDNRKTLEGDFLAKMRDVAKSLKRFATDVQPRKGRQGLDSLDHYISYLATLYEIHSGRKPGYSSQPSAKPDSRSRASHGPFVRFCEDVVGLVTPAYQRSIFDAVRRVVRRRRSLATLRGKKGTARS